jgi:hypothetical protein
MIQNERMENPKRNENEVIQPPKEEKTQRKAMVKDQNRPLEKGKHYLHLFKSHLAIISTENTIF